jgi:ABC-type antimicrobial peptide transport system permease subunit
LRASTTEYRQNFPGNLDFNDTFNAVPIREFLVGDVRRLLQILLGAVGLVLLIACANVANLFLVRSRGRSREIAVRTALGAGQGRIVRQLMTESLLLSFAGGAAGLALGHSAIRALLAVDTASPKSRGERSSSVPRLATGRIYSSGFDLHRHYLWSLTCAPGCAADLNVILKSGGGRTNTGLRQNRSRAILVVSEVTLAVVLLVGSALLIRSFVALYSVDRGFDINHVLAMRSLLASPRYSKSAIVNQAI